MMNTTRKRAGSRKLYNANQNAEFDVDDVGEITFKDVVDILADLMDDEVS